MATNAERVAAACEAFSKYGGADALLVAVHALGTQSALEDAPPELRDYLTAVRPGVDDSERLAAYRRLAELIPWRLSDRLLRRALRELAEREGRHQQALKRELLAYGVGVALAAESEPQTHRLHIVRDGRLVSVHWIKDERGRKRAIPPDGLPWGTYRARLKRTPNYPPLRHFLDWLQCAAVAAAEDFLPVSRAALARNFRRVDRRKAGTNQGRADDAPDTKRPNRVVRQLQLHEEMVSARDIGELAPEDWVLREEARGDLAAVEALAEVAAIELLARAKLSAREREVALELAGGPPRPTEGQIARDLNMAVGTVRTYKARIRSKLRRAGIDL